MHYRFANLNGISVACLMDNMLILFAIRNQMSDPLVVIMASFIYLAMPFMFVGKRLASRIGVARTWAVGWYYRYLLACLMIVAPFLHPIAPAWVVSSLILVGAFGFAFFRTIGLVAQKPLTGEITVANDRGRFLAGVSRRVNTGHLITAILIIVWLRYSDGLWVYQSIFAIGCAAGLYTSTIIARMPESCAPRLSARRPLATTFRMLLADPASRHLLLAWSAGFAAFSLVLPMMVVTIKNGYAMSDYAAFFYSLLFMLGAIGVTLINGAIADRVDARLMLQVYQGLLILAALYWAFAPNQFNAIAGTAAFVLAGGGKAGIILSLNHYFLDAIDRNHRVGSALVVQMLAGGVAGLAGAGFGGGLLQWLSNMGIEGMDAYRAYFKVALAAMLMMMATTLRVRASRPTVPAA